MLHDIYTDVSFMMLSIYPDDVNTEYESNCFSENQPLKSVHTALCWIPQNTLREEK